MPATQLQTINEIQTLERGIDRTCEMFEQAIKRGATDFAAALYKSIEQMETKLDALRTHMLRFANQ